MRSRPGSFSAVIVFAASGTCFALGQTPLGAGFTYQGQLTQNGAPYTGSANLVFTLYDAPSGGNLLGTQSLNGVAVTSGLFTVLVNGGGEFGANAFNGDRRWLDIAVDGTPLAPRQELTATPNALFALNADQLDGLDSAMFLQSIPVPLDLSGAQPLAIITGANSGTSDVPVGVYGAITSSGVSGISCGGYFTNIDDAGFAIYGRATGSSAYGVYGQATSAAGTTYGVYGVSESSDGFGVCGESAQNAGVRGNATGTSGTNFGVWGQSASISGRGVLGQATSSSGPACGVWGSSASTAGHGVRGEAIAGSGTTYGGLFRNYSSDGFAGAFQNLGTGTSHDVEISGPNGALNTQGFLYREYDGAVPRAAIPIAYGSIAADGTIHSGTGNFTVSQAATGQYDITISGETYSNAGFTVTITPVTNSPRITGVADSGVSFRVNMWNLAGTLVDNAFQFTTWTANPSAPG